jgi:hypothetical protein
VMALDKITCALVRTRPSSRSRDGAFCFLPFFV